MRSVLLNPVRKYHSLLDAVHMMSCNYVFADLPL
jgi:hypothetical protein